MGAVSAGKNNLLMKLASVACIDLELGEVIGSMGQAVVLVLGYFLAAGIEIEVYIAVSEMASPVTSRGTQSRCTSEHEAGEDDDEAHGCSSAVILVEWSCKDQEMEMRKG